MQNFMGGSTQQEHRGAMEHTRAIYCDNAAGKQNNMG